MSKLIMNKNEQATITIPKELIQALSWKKSDKLLVSKAPGNNYLIVENISKNDENSRRK